MSNMKSIYSDFTIAVKDYTSFIRDAAERGDLDEMLRDVESLRREIIRAKELS
jgi:hypothetical protein